MSKLRDMLAVSGWFQELTEAEQWRVVADTHVRAVPKGGFVCRKGDLVDSWIGVIEGLVKIAMVNSAGKLFNAVMVPAPGWFGEGSVLKDESRRYDAIALRDSQIAYMPRATFRWLSDNNIGFVRFLMVQLNERLSQFIGAVESDRLLDPDQRVARCIASLFNPILYPGMSSILSLSQEEMGCLVGLSRQRVNRSLRTLEDAGLLRVDYGGIRVLNLSGLYSFEPASEI